MLQVSSVDYALFRNATIKNAVLAKIFELVFGLIVRQSEECGRRRLRYGGWYSYNCLLALTLRIDKLRTAPLDATAESERQPLHTEVANLVGHLKDMQRLAWADQALNAELSALFRAVDKMQSSFFLSTYETTARGRANALKQWRAHCTSIVEAAVGYLAQKDQELLLYIYFVCLDLKLVVPQPQCLPPIDRTAIKMIELALESSPPGSIEKELLVSSALWVWVSPVPDAEKPRSSKEKKQRISRMLRVMLLLGAIRRCPGGKRRIEVVSWAD